MFITAAQVCGVICLSAMTTLFVFLCAKQIVKELDDIKRKNKNENE